MVKLGYEGNPSEEAKDAMAAAADITTIMGDVLRMTDGIDEQINGHSYTQEQYNLLCEDLTDAAETFIEEYTDATVNHGDKDTATTLYETRKQVQKAVLATYTLLNDRYGEPTEETLLPATRHAEDRCGIDLGGDHRRDFEAY